MGGANKVANAATYDVPHDVDTPPRAAVRPVPHQDGAQARGLDVGDRESASTGGAAARPMSQ